MAARPKTPATCPVCSEDVPPRALACPECGADHNSGWKEDVSDYDGAGLPDEEFDYEAFVREEFGRAAKPTGLKWRWWVTAILVLIAMAALFLYRW